jgi:hypothetical protein
LGDGDGGGQVSEVVDVAARDVGVVAECVEVPEHVTGVEGSSVGASEDETAVEAADRSGVSFIGAVFEGCGDAVGDGDPVLAGAGLRGA